MAAFFRDLLEKFTEPVFLERVGRKFHFGETQSEKLQAVAEEMLPLMYGEAFWERRTSCVWNAYQMQNSGAAYEDVVMSLGSGLDRLQDKYTEKGALSESYMLETLASELLLDSYGAYNRYVQENTDWHVARYHFPGSEEKLSLEMVPMLLKGSERITCNAAFCILPKKSVVFIAQLTQDMQTHCEAICAGCSNLHCPNRVADDSPKGRLIARMADLPLSYGYRRIFNI